MTRGLFHLYGECYADPSVCPQHKDGPVPVVEPLADWEREYLESPRSRATMDAATLRNAAVILSELAKRKTFTLQVIIRLLERTASKLDHPSH